jgi:hypothetical protein
MDTVPVLEAAAAGFRDLLPRWMTTSSLAGVPCEYRPGEPASLVSTNAVT